MKVYYVLYNPTTNVYYNKDINNWVSFISQSTMYASLSDWHHLFTASKVDNIILNLPEYFEFKQIIKNDDIKNEF